METVRTRQHSKNDRRRRDFKIEVYTQLSMKELSIGDLAFEMNLSTQTLWNRLNGFVKDWEQFRPEIESALKRL